MPRPSLTRLLPLALLAAAGCSEREAAPKTEAPAAAPAAAPEASAAEFDAAMKALVDPYLRIQKTLAEDATGGVSAAAAQIAAAAAKLSPPAVTGAHAARYAALPADLAAAARAVEQAGDLAATREAFKRLSKPMALWASVRAPEGIDVVYCSMAEGSWLQATGPIRNPYHGSEMLACGEVVSGPGREAAQ